MIKARRKAFEGKDPAERELLSDKKIQLAQMLPDAPKKPIFGRILEDDELLKGLECIERWLASYLHSKQKEQAQAKKISKANKPR